jgi:hypothetical protein
MIKTGTLIAGALIAVVSFSASSFAQGRSSYDAELQRLNDIRQQTTDSGLNTISRPLSRTPLYGTSISDRQFRGVYRQPTASYAR